MFRSLKIGKAFGIGLYVHSTFLLLPILVLILNWTSDLGQLLLHQATVLVIFACVLLHELGHALMARQFGIQTRDITLYPIGGVARLERMSEEPVEEILIAVAGPAVNVVIAMALFGYMLLTGFPSVNIEELGWDGWGSRLLLLVLAGNVMLVLFNMLPIFPMDGGRVFRAVLATGLGQLRATEIASVVGIVLGSLLGLGMLFAGIWLAPLVVFNAIMAGRQELMMVRMREAQRQASYWREPVDVLPLDPPYVRALPAPPEPNFSGFTWDRDYHVWIEWRNGWPIEASGHYR